MVAPGLFVGSRPQPGYYRWAAAIVFCAKEHQPPSFMHPNMAVIYAPMDDVVPMPKEQIALAISTARTVSRYLMSGRRVLVTCFMGWNRSGLVAALAMRMAFGLSAEEAINAIRAARGPNALSNTDFVRVIENFDPNGRRRSSR